MGKSLEHGYGLLNYDDDSDHIIVKYPLTSNDVAGHGGATVVGTGASTFDSVRGYKPYYTDGTSNAPANGYLKWDAASNPLVPADEVYKILGGYTIGFDVETEHLYTLLHNLVLCSINPVTASEEVRLLINSLGQVQMNNSSRTITNTTNTVFSLASVRHPDDTVLDPTYTTVRLSVSSGGKIDVFFGYHWMFSGKFTLALVSDTNPLRLFTLAGFTGGESFPGYSKNLFVVDGTILLPTDRKIGRIADIGDSITQQVNTVANTNAPFNATYYGSVAVATAELDYSLPHQLFRRMAELGRYVEPYVFAVSGAKIYNNGTRILSQVDGTNAANARNHRPQVITCGGGANDVREEADMTDGAAGTFGHGYREILDEVLSWGCVELFVFANIMSMLGSATDGSAAKQALVLVGNATIEALKAEYEVSYPDVTFVIADRYTAFGGANPDQTLFDDGLHPSKIGNYVHTMCIADAIIASGL